MKIASRKNEKPSIENPSPNTPPNVAVSVRTTSDAAQDREDLLATAVAAYIVLLGAHARGLAGYWRTVPLLERLAGD